MRNEKDILNEKLEMRNEDKTLMTLNDTRP